MENQKAEDKWAVEVVKFPDSDKHFLRLITPGDRLISPVRAETVIRVTDDFDEALEAPGSKKHLEVIKSLYEQARAKAREKGLYIVDSC